MIIKVANHSNWQLFKKILEICCVEIQIDWLDLSKQSLNKYFWAFLLLESFNKTILIIIQYYNFS